MLNPRIYYSFPLNRTLSSLDQASNVNNLSSSTSVSPQNINNGKSVVAVVYTPPDSFNQDTGSNRTIKVNVSELDNSVKTVLEIPIRLYRPLQSSSMVCGRILVLHGYKLALLNV